MSRKASKEQKQKMLKLMRNMAKTESRVPALNHIEKMVRAAKIALKHKLITLSEFQEEIRISQKVTV